MDIHLENDATNSKATLHTALAMNGRMSICVCARACVFYSNCWLYNCRNNKYSRHHHQSVSPHSIKVLCIYSRFKLITHIVYSLFSLTTFSSPNHTKLPCVCTKTNNLYLPLFLTISLELTTQIKADSMYSCKSILDSRYHLHWQQLESLYLFTQLFLSFYLSSFRSRVNTSLSKYGHTFFGIIFFLHSWKHSKSLNVSSMDF